MQPQVRSDIFSCFQAVRQIRFERLRRSVAQKLFLGMETFSQPLIDLHAKLHKIQEMSFCSVTPHHTYLLEDFKELQRSMREQNTKPRLGEVADDVQQVRLTNNCFGAKPFQALELLCSQVEKQAQIYRDSIRDESELLDRTGDLLIITSSQSRSHRQGWNCFRDGADLSIGA